MRRAAAVLALLGALGAAGCQSTQDKSAKLAAQATGLERQQGVTITRENADVKVLGTSVLTDANGSAVVVRLDNTAEATQVDVPVAVTVKSAADKAVFTNDAPGLDKSLTHAFVLPSGESVWVNDQVFATEKPRSAEAKVGAPEASAPASLPDLRVTGVRLDQDPVSGLSAVGVVSNPSAEFQQKVLVTALARKGGKVVAAGRGVVPKIKPGKRARFRVFFIGSPKGAEVTVTAQPTRIAP